MWQKKKKKIMFIIVDILKNKVLIVEKNEKPKKI